MCELQKLSNLSSPSSHWPCNFSVCFSLINSSYTSPPSHWPCNFSSVSLWYILHMLFPSQAVNMDFFSMSLHFEFFCHAIPPLYTEQLNSSTAWNISDKKKLDTCLWYPSPPPSFSYVASSLALFWVQVIDG